MVCMTPKEGVGPICAKLGLTELLCELLHVFTGHECRSISVHVDGSDYSVFLGYRKLAGTFLAREGHGSLGDGPGESILQCKSV